MTKRLTDISVRNAKPKASRYELSDGGSALRLIVQSSGVKSFAARFRVGGQTKKLTFPRGTSLQVARKLTADALLQAHQGIDPCALKKTAKAEAAGIAKNTLAHVCAQYFKAVAVRDLRTISDRERVLRVNILPVLGSRPVTEIRRSELMRVHDDIASTRGERTAAVTLGALSVVFNWYALRDDHFANPIIKGMASYKPKDHVRNVTLTDEQIFKVWHAAGQLGVYGSMIRFLMCSGARFDEAAGLRWDEIENGTWVLPASRNKVKVDLARPLSRLAKNVLANIPRYSDCPFVFTLDGRRPFNSPSRFKRMLDAASGVTGWVVHDLRRVVRTEMSALGISVDIGERCLGHVVGGIRGTYDKYAALPEKLAAFEALGAELERIIAPPPVDGDKKVVQLRSA
jgi:integrase